MIEVALLVWATAVSQFFWRLGFVDLSLMDGEGQGVEQAGCKAGTLAGRSALRGNATHKLDRSSFNIKRVSSVSDVDSTEISCDLTCLDDERLACAVKRVAGW